MSRVSVSFFAVAALGVIIGRWSTELRLPPAQTRAQFGLGQVPPAEISVHSTTTDAVECVPDEKVLDRSTLPTIDPLVGNASECEAALSLVKFVESWKSDFRLRPSNQPPIRVASFSTASMKVVNEVELFKNLDESFARVNAAKERHDKSPTLENKVMLGCWLIIHGEMLALPPASRIVSSLQSLEDGENLLGEAKEGGAKAEAEIKDLEAKNPNVALLLHTMSFRKEVILAAKEKNVAVLIAENKQKTRLTEMYRELAYLILNADSSYHLREWDSSANSYKEATSLSGEIKKFAALEKSDVLNNAELDLLKDRKLFVLEGEPKANQPNPQKPKEFIKDISLQKLLPTVSALARLRLIQGDTSSGVETKVGTIQDQLKAIKDDVLSSLFEPDTIADNNPLGYAVRGLARETQAMLLVENALATPGNLNPNDVLEEFDNARKGAINDLQKAKELVPPVVNNPGERVRVAGRNSVDNAVAANDTKTALAAVRLVKDAPVVIAAIPNPTFVIVEQSEQRLTSPDQTQEKIIGRLNDGRGDEAWLLAQQLVLRHPNEEASWSEYLVTGMRTYQTVEKLETGFKLAVSFGVFAKQPWREHEISGRLALYAGRKKILETRSVIESLLVGQPGGPNEEKDRLQRAAKSFEQAIAMLGKAVQEAPAEGKRDQLRLRAFRAQAGALAALVTPTRDVREMVKYKQDAIFTEQQSKTELMKINGKMEPAARLDIVEADAIAKQAYGLLNLLDDDPSSIRVGKEAIAVSNDVFGSLKFGGQSLVENGSLLLGALLVRDDPKGQLLREPQVRRALQMTVEGLVLGELGNPDYGVDRVNRANSFLNSKLGGDAQYVPPTEYVWGLLRDEKDEVDAGGVEKMARLSGLLLRLKQQSSSHSRFLGDVAQPTQIDADGLLGAAIAVIGDERPELTLAGARMAASRTQRPVEAIALALAAESKARSFRLSKSEERSLWMKLAHDLVNRADSLRVESEQEFAKKYPLLALLQKELVSRIVSSERYLLSAKSAESRFRFDEAEQRLRDGLSHHPSDSELWQSLASLVLTRLDVDRFSGDAVTTSEDEASKSLKDVFTAWKEHKPNDGWRQDFLQAQFLSIGGHNQAALQALADAQQKLPAGDAVASTLVESKNGEITAKLLLEEREKALARRSQSKQ